LFLKIGRTGFVISLLFLLFITAPSHVYPKGKRQKGGNELKFWHSIGTYNKDVLTSIIQSFNESQKPLIVNGVFQGDEENLFIKLISQENLPDLVLLPVQFLPALKEKNCIIALDSYIPQKLRGDIPEKFWESVSLDNNIFGVPFSYSTNILYVNQHLLRISGTRNEKEPQSWQEILTITKKIKENTDRKWGIFIPMETAFHFISFVQSYTGKSVFHDQKLVINTEAVIYAMTYLQELVFQYGLMPPKMTSNEGDQIFLSGNLGIIMASSSMLVYTESNLPYNLTVWHLPLSGRALPAVYGLCLAVIKSNTKREIDALKFIEYMMSYNSIVKWHTHTGTPAVLTSVKESIDLLICYEENPNYMTSVIETEKGAIINPGFVYLNINKIIKNALEEIMINGNPPGEILDRAQKEIDTLQGS